MNVDFFNKKVYPANIIRDLELLQVIPRYTHINRRDSRKGSCIDHDIYTNLPPHILECDVLRLDISDHDMIYVTLDKRDKSDDESDNESDDKSDDQSDKNRNKKRKKKRNKKRQEKEKITEETEDRKDADNNQGNEKNIDDKQKDENEGNEVHEEKRTIRMIKTMDGKDLREALKNMEMTHQEDQVDILM